MTDRIAGIRPIIDALWELYQGTTDGAEPFGYWLQTQTRGSRQPEYWLRWIQQDWRWWDGPDWGSLEDWG